MSLQLRIKPDEKFGRLTAVKFIETDDHGNARWLFACECGEEHVAIAHVVRRGDTKSCGCLRFKVIKPGEKFAMLTAVEPAGFGKKGVQRWLFGCECGKHRVLDASHVRRGRISSCGCAPPTRKARASKITTMYGVSGVRAEILADKSRCDICGQPEVAKNKNGHPRGLSVDHCHSTGMVRGTLCSICNRILGFYEKGWRPNGPIPAFDLYLTLGKIA